MAFTSDVEDIPVVLRDKCPLMPKAFHQYARLYRYWRLEQDPDLYIRPWCGQGFLVRVCRRAAWGFDVAKTFSGGHRRTTEQVLQMAREFRDSLPDECFVAYRQGEYTFPGIYKLFFKGVPYYRVDLNSGKGRLKRDHTIASFNDPFAAAVQTLFDYLGVQYPAGLFRHVVDTSKGGADYLLKYPLAYIRPEHSRKGELKGYFVYYNDDRGKKVTRYYPFSKYGSEALPEAILLRNAKYGYSDDTVEDVIKLQSRYDVAIADSMNYIHVCRRGKGQPATGYRVYYIEDGFSRNRSFSEKKYDNALLTAKRFRNEIWGYR